MSAVPASSSSSGVPQAPEDVVRRWHFTKEEMRNAASIRDGLDMRKELQYRQQGARFIQTMGDRLNQGVKETRSKISQLCMCSAMIHMHRFYYFHSFKFFDFRDMAAACLFLAGKSEECPRKLEHIVKVWWQLKYPKYPSIPKKYYNDAAQLIVTLENVILQTIAFDLKIDLPHAVVLQQMQLIARGNKKLTEVAYFFATDVLCVTDWAIRYTAAEIAAVCIYIVCLWANHQIVQPEAEEPWYKKITTLTLEELEEIANEFLSIYDSCKDSLKLTKFIHKGYISQPGRPIKIEGGGQAQGQTLLPPPPAPPTIHRKMDLSEYKNRSANSTPGSLQGTPAPRNNFMMPDPSALGATPITHVSHTNGHPEDISSGTSAREHRHKEHKKHKEHKEHKKDREHKDRHRDEDRERRRDRDHDRKREHDKTLSSSGASVASLHPAEKRPRPDAGSAPGTVPPLTFMATPQGDKRASSAGIAQQNWRGSAAMPNKATPITNGSCRLEPAAFNTSTGGLPPPPPPPTADELEDGEVA